MKDTPYFSQANLLLRLLPYVREEEFALKGGTAINYFYRDLPRLSIDIDLTFLPLMNRAQSLEHISSALQRISERIMKWPDIKLNLKKVQKYYIRLVVEERGMAIKIEPNFVLRGTVFPPKERKLVKTARQLFEMEISFNCLPKVYFLRQIQPLDDKAIITVANQVFHLPVEYIHYFVYIEWNLVTENLTIFLEKDKKSIIIERFLLPINTVTKQKLVKLKIC